MISPSRPSQDQRRLAAALGLIVAFMLGEVVIGVIAHSLALMADAGHMLTDAGALGLSLVAMRLAQRPPAGGLTYGLKRAEILSALGNGVTLLVLAGVIVYESIHRLFSPPPVAAQYVVAVALIGVAVNLAASRQLAKADPRSLNIRGSYQHILTDVFAFIATAIAGAVILITGFSRADAIASLLVAALMLRAGIGLMKTAARVLLEAAPAGMEPAAIAEAMARHPLVVDIHDLHVWEITSGMPSLSAHILVRPGEDCHRVRRDLERVLGEHFRIEHTTLQVDHATSKEQLISLHPVDVPLKPEAVSLTRDVPSAGRD
jgi:cobalt-zinc-cadmium efflux system protein